MAHAETVAVKRRRRRSIRHKISRKLRKYWYLWALLAASIVLAWIVTALASAGSSTSRVIVQ